MKNLKNLGETLSKAKQLQINGGGKGCPLGECGGWPGSCRPCGTEVPPDK